MRPLINSSLKEMHSDSYCAENYPLCPSNSTSLFEGNLLQFQLRKLQWPIMKYYDTLQYQMWIELSLNIQARATDFKVIIQNCP